MAPASPVSSKSVQLTVLWATPGCGEHPEAFMSLAAWGGPRNGGCLLRLVLMKAGHACFQCGALSTVTNSVLHFVESSWHSREGRSCLQRIPAPQIRMSSVLQNLDGNSWEATVKRWLRLKY